MTAEAIGVYQNRLFDGPFGIPKARDVVEIRAELYQSDSGLPAVSQFVVPSKYFERVLANLAGPEIDGTPNFILPEVGTLRITSKDGRVRRISWFGGQKSPLIFSLQGTRCVAMGKYQSARVFVDEAVVLEELIREALGEALKGRER